MRRASREEFAARWQPVVSDRQGSVTRLIAV